MLALTPCPIVTIIVARVPSSENVSLHADDFSDCCLDSEKSEGCRIVGDGLGEARTKFFITV